MWAIILFRLEKSRFESRKLVKIANGISIICNHQFHELTLFCYHHSLNWESCSALSADHSNVFRRCSEIVLWPTIQSTCMPPLLWGTNGVQALSFQSVLKPVKAECNSVQYVKSVRLIHASPSLSTSYLYREAIRYLRVLSQRLTALR